MADINLKDIKDGVKQTNARLFRTATENVFPLMEAFRDRGINLPGPQDTMAK